MHSSDLVVVLLVELLLAALFIRAVVMDIRARSRRSLQGVHADVERGEQSMNWLYVMYGITTVVYALIVQEAEVLKGHHAVLIAANYVAITYLFFFSSWFRNRVLFPLLVRVRQD